jgi:hypothetical protein
MQSFYMVRLVLHVPAKTLKYRHFRSIIKNMSKDALLTMVIDDEFRALVDRYMQNVNALPRPLKIAAVCRVRATFISERDALFAIHNTTFLEYEQGVLNRFDDGRVEIGQAA